MNCAKCLKARKQIDRRSFVFTPKTVAIVATGKMVNGETQFKCPECSSLFWFPKLAGETPVLPV